MTLAAATRLGPYEIVAPLGAGGMGEVYRAKDTRLGRDVAVKVLPADVASDFDRLRRFEQEAKAASAIQHPNLLSVFDVGSHDGIAYLVTELLAGESLRELVRRGPLATRRAVELMVQLAKGLAAAHDHGIVHRDLKPENLFLTRDGVAKILDFGLARVERPELSQANLNELSTVLETSAGTVLGTVGYMAPEQVRGERADARSDLFSLGVVLYELVAGANPFRCDSTIESLNAILKTEPPDLAAMASAAPPALARIVARLLEKDPARRFRSAHDLAFALEATAETPSGGQVALRPGGGGATSHRLWRALLAAAALLAGGFALGTLGVRPSSPEAARAVRFEIAPPAAGGFPGNAEMHNLALAPDGRALAYVTSEHGQSLLHLRDFDRVEPRPLAGTEGAESPFWSPDGASLAFFAGGKLKRVARGDGPVQTICDVQGNNTGAWSSDGTIVFSQGFGPNNGLFRVAAGGGTPKRLSTVGDLPRWIEALPGGRQFLYWDRTQDALGGKVQWVDLASGVTRTLPGVTSRALYAAPGWLLHLRGSTLAAQRFDAGSGELSGEPIPLVSGVPFFFNGWAAFSVAGSALAYQVRSAPGPLDWYDRHGRELGEIGPAALFLGVRISPDGAAAAVTRSDPETAFTDVWIVDLVRGGATRLTDEPYLDWSPAWSPDGELVAYTTTTPGPRFTVKVRRATDTREIASLPPHPTFLWVRGWNRAGAFLDSHEPATGWDLWRWAAPGGEPRPLLATGFSEMLASPSPDGRWLAFYSRESGDGEIELLASPSPSRRLRVSRGARRFVPRWRGDSGELFYVSADGWLTAIAVGPGEPPRLGEPVPLFPVDFPGEDSFDVTADGQRFLLVGPKPASSLPVTVALDWQTALPNR